MPIGDKSARELLDFYLEAGVDALVGEEPVDRFAPEPAPAPARAADRNAPNGRPQRSDRDRNAPSRSRPAPGALEKYHFPGGRRPASAAQKQLQIQMPSGASAGNRIGK